MLEDWQDAFGHEIHDHFKGKGGYEIIERDDGFFSTSTGPRLYFLEYEEWPASEQEAMKYVRGKVLDVGCGAGRHSLYLQGQGFDVVGIDNLSKYGLVEKSYDNHQNYTFILGDAKDVNLMKDVLADCDHVLAGAAMIGGISYFHEFAYDLLAENERITASTFDAAIHAFRNGRLKKITLLSSSMVFESTGVFPTPEGNQLLCPPPRSTYGFQKLASEYFAKGAWEQYQLPFTIVRPFNCSNLESPIPRLEWFAVDEPHQRPTALLPPDVRHIHTFYYSGNSF